MVGFVTILSEKFNLKMPKRSEKNIFTIYSPKKDLIEKADTLTVDTELSIKLTQNSSAFLATKFEGQEIIKIIGPTNTKKRLWITLLNESYFEKYTINKGDVIGYFIIEPDDIKVHYAGKEKTSRWKMKPPNNYLPKDWQKHWKNYFQKKKSRRQTGGFLSRYDFVYAGRDVVNQVGKVAPKMISQATGEINKIPRHRIDQVVRSGGAEIERVAPKIIRGAIEEVYKTPFRLLGNLGKKQFQKIKIKLLK